MEVRQRPPKASFLWTIMFAGAVLIVAFPVAIDCCQEFRGWLQDTPLFKGMVENNIVTGNEVRSFEISFYLYLVVCLGLSLSYAVLNRDIIFSNASERGENVTQACRRAIKSISPLLLFTLFVIFPMYVRPELGVKQGLKGWLLIKITFAGAAYIIGLLSMFLLLMVDSGTTKQSKTGDEK
jgi:hypothetical protein